MSRSILIYLILSSCLIAIALSCECEMVSVEDNLNQSVAVFSGKVVKITPDRSGDNLIVKFIVRDVWKGDRVTTVRTAREDSMCGFGFIKGGEYVVFASMEDGKLTTSNCDRTKKLDDEIVNELNELTRPNLAY
jgi:hypothetical protein